MLLSRVGASVGGLDHAESTCVKCADVPKTHDVFPTVDKGQYRMQGGSTTCEIGLMKSLTLGYQWVQGLTEIAGLDIDGRVKKRGWTLQDWTMTDEFAGVDIAGLDIDGRLRRGGHCTTGH